MNSNQSTTLAAKLLFGAGIIIIILHVWGAFQPFHENWGVHLFGFFQPMVGLFTLVILLICSLPTVQSVLLKGIESLVRFFSRLPVIVSFLTALGIVVGGAFLFAPQLHLLGDGAILMRSIPRAQWGEDILLSFRNQPLLEIIYRWVMSFYPSNTPPREIYFTIDLVGAALYLIIIFWGIRNLQRPPIERFLLGIFLFFGAGCQFFFGYVENYVMQYVATTAYVFAGWLALEKKISLLIPIMLFPILPGVSLPSLIFIPSFMYLIFWRFRENKLLATGILGGIGVMGIAVLFMIGFNFYDFFTHLTRSNIDFLPAFTTFGGFFPYPMISLRHLLDWLNANWLIIPFGLFIPVALFPFLTKEFRKNSPALLFLVITALCGVFFTFIVNAALGMARDWDMLSSFFVPLSILSVFLLANVSVLEPRRHILLFIVIITICHSAAWIGVNASYERHLARMRTLNSPALLSLAAQMSYSEALANFFFDTKQYSDAKHYYLQYMKIDSFNHRILGNISDVYRKLNDKENYFESLKRAARLNNPNPGIYSNLGVEYAGRGDTANAIALNERAIALDPKQQKAHANLGILYMSKKNYTRADQHFTAALNLGMRDQVLLRYAGDVAVFLGYYPRALRYYDAYLELSPTDQRVRNVREKVRALILKTEGG